MMFFGKIGSNMSIWIDVAHKKICTPQIDLYNEVRYASNGDCMPKLHPREVEAPIYRNGAHSFGTSSPRVRFLDV